MTSSKPRIMILPVAGLLVGIIAVVGGISFISRTQAQQRATLTAVAQAEATEEARATATARTQATATHVAGVTATAEAGATATWQANATREAEDTRATQAVLIAAAATNRARAADWYDLDQAAFWACYNEGTAEAPAYTPGSPPYRVAFYKVLDALMEFESPPVGLAAEQMAGSIAETQLIVCVNDGYQVVENCLYSGNHGLIRRQFYRRDDLVALQTGTLVASQTFYGEYPEACPASYGFGGPGSEYLDGPEEYDLHAEAEWLASILMP